jgi:hypothetical protein
MPPLSVVSLVLVSPAFGTFVKTTIEFLIDYLLLVLRDSRAVVINGGGNLKQQRMCHRKMGTKMF